MKNVLQIMDYAAPYRGNFIPSIEALEAHWQGKGNMVFLFPDVAQSIPWVQDYAKNHRVYYIDRNFFSKKINVALIKELQHIIEQEKIDVVHTHFIQAPYNLYILRCFYTTKIRFVTNLHNHYMDMGKLYKLKRWVYLHTYDFVIGDSESVTESALAIGVPTNKIITARNSINFSRLDHFTLQDFAENGKYAYTLLMFGYPWHRKGVDVVARAVAQLNKQMPTRLLLAQSGDHEVTREAIRGTLGELPIWVEMLPPTESLSDYYNSVDAFISAGREEGLSYSPIEAAYCGCDVICSNIQGNPLDILEIGIYETEDVDALANTLRERLSASAEVKEKRKNVQRAYVIKSYDIDKWADKVISVY